MARILIAGNWKMFKTIGEAVDLVEGVKAGLHTVHGVDIAICPPFTALSKVNELLQNTNIDLGAQNMYSKNEGAFTGEISPLMLKDTGCRYVILGHSERRQFFHETDKTVNEKVKLALNYKLDPIVCIGETLDQREKGETFNVIRHQFENSLKDLKAEELIQIVIAYEPVWAIGTGKNATSDQAQEVHAFIRQLLKSHSSEHIASQIRILYGGSVKPDNIQGLTAQPDVNGALVGGASLKAESFVQIVVNSIQQEEQVNS
jgi:triosephosphate isomerase